LPPDLRFHPSIWLEEPRKTMKNLTQDSVSPVEYKSKYYNLNKAAWYLLHTQRRF
jgi:hypothetical protein